MAARSMSTDSSAHAGVTTGRRRSETISLGRRRRPGEALIQGFLFFCAAVSILTTLGIVLVLFEEALAFFRDPNVSLVDFFTTTAWQPKIGQFGIFPLFLATLLTSMIGMLVALPVGLGIAIYLSEYAAPKPRSILKPVLEVLAGIPTVVYGYFALNFITPIIRSILGRDNVDIFNMASAGLVIGILIVPLVASMSEDALSAIPRSLREGAYALGATKLETALKIVVPAALSGLGAAFIVAISRRWARRWLWPSPPARARATSTTGARPSTSWPCSTRSSRAKP